MKKFPTQMYLAKMRNVSFQYFKGVQIILVMEGSVSLELNQKHYLLEKNDFILINCHDVVSIQGHESNIILILNVPLDYLQNECEEFLKYRQSFPCFVLTAFDDLAVSASEDVNKIYIKNILHNNKEESKAKAKFLDRVINQIEHYQTKIKNAEAELLELIKLRESGKANISDESRIIELDCFLENVIDRRSSIPPEYKNYPMMIGYAKY